MRRRFAPCSAGGLRRLLGSRRHNEGRQALARRLLDAAGGLRQADPRLPEDPGRERRQLQPVLRRLGRPERAVEAGLKADIVALRSSPDVDALVDAGLVDATGTRQRTRAWSPTRSWSSSSARATRRTSRLGRPDQGGRRGHHPEPVHFRRRPLEHHGRVRRAARGRQDRAGRPRTTCGSSSRTSPCRTRAPATRCRPSAAARATCCSPTRTRRSPPRPRARARLRDPAPTILIENPVAVMKNSEHQEEAKAFLDFLPTPEAQKIFAEKGYRPVSKAVAKQLREVPDAARSVHDRRLLGGWAEVKKEFFDPREGSWRGSTAGRWCHH